MSELERQVRELTEFVAALQMGAFYAKRLGELFGPLGRAFVMSLGGGPDPEYERAVREANRDYRAKLRRNREAAVASLVEQLRYQPWGNEA